jgi:hypothetical protein
MLVSVDIEQQICCEHYLSYKIVALYWLYKTTLQSVMLCYTGSYGFISVFGTPFVNMKACWLYRQLLNLRGPENERQENITYGFEHSGVAGNG